MSSRDDRVDGETRAERLIYDRQEKLEAVLDVFSAQAVEVELTPELKRQIAKQILNYHRVLSKLSDEAVLSESPIPDISPIRERMGRKTEVLVESDGWDAGVSYEQRPAVDELDFAYLEGVADELETAAKKLGFWATAKVETTHRTEIDDDLIEEVEQWRQKNLED